MLTPQDGKALARKAGRRALAPLADRLDRLNAALDTLRGDLDGLRGELGVRLAQQDILAEQQAAMAAALEQAIARTIRQEAYLDRLREELLAEFGDLAEVADGVRSIFDDLGVEDRSIAGASLRAQFDDLYNRIATAGDGARAELAPIRSTVRLTQALVERVLDQTDTTSANTTSDTATTDTSTTDAGTIDAATGAAEPAAARPGPRAGAGYRNPAPSFDLLYRSFEDHHRGDPATIRDSQRDDYLELVRSVPTDDMASPDLPVVDLGCGRGELVALLDDEGIPALGVDANLGQVVGGDDRLFTEADLFTWLDARDDQSCRAVLAMHVVEHLPLDLQVRLVFEGHRVLAPGGLLVLETPNAFSISTAATNFWVDPTHERPVHPMFLEFLAEEAGFVGIELRPLHQIDMHLPDEGTAPRLVEVLDSLLLGKGDLALIARRL